MDPPHLSRKDVYIRPLHAADAAPWFHYLTDPRVFELTSYDIRSVEEVSATIDDYIARGQANQLTRWAIASVHDDGLIGTCGFHSSSPRDQRAELGYDLSPMFWGRGIATDVVAAVVGAAFGATDLNRVDALARVDNTRSHRVLEKCAFSREGRLAQYRNCRGSYRDFYIYGRLRAASM